MLHTVSALPFHNKVRLLSSHMAPTTVSIMNFNLLAKCYGSDSLNAIMPFEERRRLNSAHVQHHRPSILVTEEMDECYLDDFASFGYRKINLHKNENSNCYTGVFLREDTALKCKASEVVKIDASRSQGVIFAHIVFDVSHPQLGPAPGAAPMSHILSEFVLMATHAKAGRTDELEALRTSDAKHTFTHLLPEFIRSKCGGSEFDKLMKRVIFVGDMNASPHSYNGQFPVSRVVPWLLGQEKLENGESTAQESIKNPVHLISGFMKELKQPSSSENNGDNISEHPLFTTCKARDGKLIVQTIDYVFLTKEVGDVVGRLESPTEEPEKDLAPHFLPLPEKWGSDHLSVMVFVTLK